MAVLIVTEEELQRAVDTAAAVDAVERSFAALASGRARLPDPVSLELPEVEGEVHVKGAHIEGAPTFTFKVATGFWKNPRLGLPTGAGLMMVFDARTGVPRALLLDNAWLTDVRTGAAGAVAARYLARARLERVAVLGAGVQARHQLRCLAVVRELPAVVVWSRHRQGAEEYAEEVRHEHGVDSEVVGSAEAAVTDADLVLTTTPSREPLVRPEWLRPGVHITAVGSDAPDKQELDVGVLAAAHLVVVDRIGQAGRLGELHHAIAAGALTTADVHAELGEIIRGDRPGRTGETQITVCDLTGLGVQDAAIAQLALERVAELGLGHTA